MSNNSESLPVVLQEAAGKICMLLLSIEGSTTVQAARGVQEILKDFLKHKPDKCEELLGRKNSTGQPIGAEYFVSWGWWSWWREKKIEVNPAEVLRKVMALSASYEDEVVKKISAKIKERKTGNE